MKKIVAKRTFRNFRKSVTRGTLAPVTTAKLKKRPRGKPFPKGHSIGVATRWKKGQPSPNPSGRPACKEINRAARAKLAEQAPSGRTYAEEFVEVLTLQGLDGSIAAISLLADRAEGRPAVALSIDETADPLAQLCLEMAEVSRKLGPPENQIIPQLQSTDEEGRQ